MSSFRGIGTLPFASNNQNNHNQHPSATQQQQQQQKTSNNSNSSSQPYPLPERDERSLSAANHLALLQENVTVVSNYIKEQTKVLFKINIKFHNDYSKYQQENKKKEEQEQANDDLDDDDDSEEEEEEEDQGNKKKKRRGKKQKQQKDSKDKKKKMMMKPPPATTKKKQKQKMKKGSSSIVVVDMNELISKHTTAVDNHIQNLNKATQLLEKIQLEASQAITSLGASVSKASYAQRRVQLAKTTSSSAGRAGGSGYSSAGGAAGAVGGAGFGATVSHHNKWTLETRFYRVYDDMIGLPTTTIVNKEGDEGKEESSKKKKKPNDAEKQDDDDDDGDDEGDKDKEDDDNNNKKRKATTDDQESKDDDDDDDDDDLDDGPPRKKKAASNNNKKFKDKGPSSSSSSSSKKKAADAEAAEAITTTKPNKTRQEILLEAPEPTFDMPSDGKLYTVREVFPQLMGIYNVQLRHKQWRYLVKHKFVPDIPKSTLHGNFWKPAKLGTLNLDRGWKQELGRRPLLTVQEVQDIVNTTPNIRELLNDPTGIENILIDVRIRKLEADGQVVDDRETLKKLYNKQTLHNYKAMFASIIQQEQSQPSSSSQKSKMMMMMMGNSNNKNNGGSNAASGSATSQQQQQQQQQRRRSNNNNNNDDDDADINDDDDIIDATTGVMALAGIDNHTKRLQEIETILQNGPKSGMPLKFTLPQDVINGYTFGEAIPQLNKIFDNKARMKMWRYLKSHNLVPNSISDSTFKYLLDLYRQNRIPDMNRPWKLTHHNNTNNNNNNNSNSNSNSTTTRGGGQQHPKSESYSDNPYGDDDVDVEEI